MIQEAIKTLWQPSQRKVENIIAVPNLPTNLFAENEKNPERTAKNEKHKFLIQKNDSTF